MGPVRGFHLTGINLTLQVVAISVSLTANTGPEGRQGVAHGVSRGIEEPPPVISAPEGRQWLPREICRPVWGCEYQRHIPSHGSRRGLLSGAAPRLSKSRHLKLTPMRFHPRLLNLLPSGAHGQNSY